MQPKTRPLPWHPMQQSSKKNFCTYARLRPATGTEPFETELKKLENAIFKT
jgi:hypothetical protein